MKSISPRVLRNIIVVTLIIGVVLLAFSGVLRPFLGVIMDPIVSVQGWLSTRFMTIYDFFTLPREVIDLLQKNAELQGEVNRLQSQVIELREQLNEAQVLYALLDFARARPQNTYLATSVIGRDSSPFLHYVIIDHGSDDGIRYGMPVVNQQGLVGTIDAVTASAARVQLITNPGSIVNVRMQTLRQEAQLHGSITGDLTLQMVPQDLNLQPGEILLTSGLGGNFPADVMVGQVLSVSKKENALFQTATLQPAVDFSSLRAVLVITNFQSINIAPLIPTPVQ